ncbi:tripartite motif-containing protein 45-like [Actinia tenebrosa]|uniref:Tripartite motif-containing protein 45-like n=1 Tax=Actinia tenebrosa TaxID=6105 RepID=A0A6P8I300_ACTTE|nr:tripartite motif-containing protein 45-like [Actinia tenebrosa]
MGSCPEDLKKDVNCSLCNDRLTEPKILKCFHTFCKPCIKRHAELIEDFNVFKCPKCNSLTPLPELDSVDNLKPSLLHSRMMKVLEFVESEKVCSVSGSHRSVSWHCFDCNRSLCDECEKNHSEFIRDHKLVSLVEIKEEDIELMLSRETNCVKHVDNIVELFCKDCQQNICMKCLKYNHDEHSTVNLSKYTAKNKAQLSKQLEELKELEQEMKKQVEVIEEETNESKANCEKAKNLVKERVREMIDMLQKNVQKLFKQIDECVERAERRQVKGHSVLDETRGAIEYMNQLIEKGVASEVIENKDMKKTCHTSVDRVVGVQSDVLFLANEELTKQVKSGLGVLRKVEKTDLRMCSINIYSHPIQGKKGKLIVTTKTKSGNLNDNPSDVIDVKITPLYKLKTFEKSVRMGKAEVEFVPKSAGQLTVEVQVNGNHVPNSPLTITVKAAQPPLVSSESERRRFLLLQEQMKI